MTIGIKHKHTGQATDPQAANPRQEEPMFWNMSPEPRSTISGIPYIQDTSLTWFPSDTTLTQRGLRTEPWDTSFRQYTGCCQS